MYMCASVASVFSRQHLGHATFKKLQEENTTTAAVVLSTEHAVVLSSEHMLTVAK